MRLPDSTRVLRVWLLTLNIGLAAIGGVLAAGGARRGLFLVAMVPLVFLPFAYARWRLHRFVASSANRRWTWALAATGMVFDATMIAQLLTARAADAGSW